jgi:plasmid stabilization system protein ParE
LEFVPILNGLVDVGRLAPLRATAQQQHDRFGRLAKVNSAPDREDNQPDRLADFPESGRIVPEMNDPSFREIILGNYPLIYRLRSGDVQIVTVHHGARELNTAELEGRA